MRAAVGHAPNMSKNTIALSELLSIAFEEQWPMTTLDDLCDHIVGDSW